MEEFFAFVREWGYYAVFFGSIIEGESIILSASALAYFGHLDIVKVMVITFFGTLFADQGIFLLGYFWGPKFFKRFPKTKIKAKKAFDYLEKYDVWFIMSFRFIYGIRALSPLVIGASHKVPIMRFVRLNFIAALIWTILSCMAGYFLANVLFEVFTYFHETILKPLLISIAVLIVTFILYKKFRSKKAHPHD